MLNKKIILIIIALILLIAGAIAFVAFQPPSGPQPAPEPQSTTSQPPEAETLQQPAPEQAQVTAGKYVNYDQTAVENTPGRKLLFFHAAWCPQCRNLEKTILEGQIPHNMTIFKVNYDSASALRQKYGVTLQTTIIEVDDQGNAIKKHVAYDDPTLPAVIKALGQ